VVEARASLSAKGKTLIEVDADFRQIQEGNCRLEVRSAAGIRFVQPVSIQAASPRRGAKAMSVRRVTICIFLCGVAWTFSQAQTAPDDPDVLLKRALHLGDLYNWADAAPIFTEAEQLYAARR